MSGHGRGATSASAPPPPRRGARGPATPPASSDAAFAPSHLKLSGPARPRTLNTSRAGGLASKGDWMEGMRRASGWVAFWCGLAAACSSQEFPPPAGGGPAGAAGGNAGTADPGVGSGGPGGPDGPPGTGAPLSCLDAPDSCVSTCAMQSATWDKGYCDSTGAFACPTGYTRTTTCPPGACVLGGSCCDQTTGVMSYRSCGPDGLLLDCPAGSVDNSSTAICIPASLGVSDCLSLSDKACDATQQQCYDGYIECFCLAHEAGSHWWCASPLPP